VSGLEGVRPAPAPAGRDNPAIPVWFPAALLAICVIGAVLVLPSIGRDESVGAFYRGRLGGSSLYRLDVAFARLLPFFAGASIALALLQRRRPRTVTVSDATIERHERAEIGTHWLNAAGIGLGLLTAAWLLRWFGDPLSLVFTYTLHFVGAALTVAAVAYHLTYEGIAGGYGLVPRSWADLRNAVAEVVGYTGVYRDIPGAFGIRLPLSVRRFCQPILRRLKIAPDPAGKFLATEKVFSYTIWSVLVGLVVVTGLIKTLNYLYPLPGGLRHAATFVHDGSTIFLLVFLGFHVGALVLVPRNWPLLRSMFTSRISRAYVQEHLPLWRGGPGPGANDAG
jgi:thiosulfate reductase cytochrome b subunit